MNGVPDSLSLNKFHGTQLEQIALGEYVIQFQFGGPHRPAIGVEEYWEVRAEDGSIIDRARKNEERDVYRVHLLLGRAVIGSEVRAPKSFLLRFDNGDCLEVFDDQTEYESFSHSARRCLRLTRRGTGLSAMTTFVQHPNFSAAPNSRVDSMVRSFEYEFQSPRDIIDIQSVWQSLGGYDWLPFDNEQYGVYIVARQPEKNLRLRLLGAKPDYSLEVDFNVEARLSEETMRKLLRDIFGSLLPAIDAVNVRDIDTPFLSSVRRSSSAQQNE